MCSVYRGTGGRAVGRLRPLCRRSELGRESRCRYRQVDRRDSRSGGRRTRAHSATGPSSKAANWSRVNVLIIHLMRPIRVVSRGAAVPSPCSRRPITAPRVFTEAAGAPRSSGGILTRVASAKQVMASATSKAVNQASRVVNQRQGWRLVVSVVLTIFGFVCLVLLDLALSTGLWGEFIFAFVVTSAAIAILGHVIL